MSANNYILISGKQPLGYYEVTEMCADTDLPFCLIGNADKILEAIKIAKDYMKENPIEYGIDFYLDYDL